MGINSTMSGIANSYETIRLASKLTPQVSKIVRKMGEERVREALTDDEKMDVFARELYEQLTPDIKTKFPLENFVGFVIANKKKLMKKKKNQKKVAARKK